MNGHPPITGIVCSPRNQPEVSLGCHQAAPQVWLASSGASVSSVGGRVGALSLVAADDADDADDGRRSFDNHRHGLCSLPSGNVVGLTVRHRVFAAVGDTVLWFP